MKQTIELLKKRIDVAAKRTPADLVIKNGKIVNVFTHEILEGDLAIADGYFAGIGRYEGHETIDVSGKYIAPGFIDGHVHIESAMITPAEFANVVLPNGVTSVIADPHEIANVSGTQGIEYMIKSSEEILLDVFFMLPSCVPATPFENAGASLNNKQLESFYDHHRVLGLGEVMDYPAVFHHEDKMLNKLAAASLKGKGIDGHAAGIDSDGINIYMAAGIRTDHECVTAEEALDRMRKGMYVMLREGSAARDLTTLLKAVTKQNARRCLFVTDDKHLDDIINEGSINHNVRVSIKEGLDPLHAIQMATLNAAECFNLKYKGAIAPGYEADFLILDDLKNIQVDLVFKSGKLVAKDGGMTVRAESTISPSSTIIDSIRTNPINKEHLQIKLNNDGMANIIRIIPNSLVTKHLIEKVDKMNGHFQSSTEKDFLKLAVMERHRNTGNIGVGIINGLGIKNGAIASTIAHDSHNIVAAGTKDDDIIKAITATAQMNGGLAVVQNGEILASLPLPIAGLMSDKQSSIVNERLTEINKALKKIGCTMEFNPFLTLSFLALPVIPELRLTDMGLFDVKTFKHIDVNYQNHFFV